MSRYRLLDGREFRALDDWEIRVAAKEGWRQQQLAEASLRRQLDASRRAEQLRELLDHRQPGQTGDLFDGA
jgi:hypothetical protein